MQRSTAPTSKYKYRPYFGHQMSKTTASPEHPRWSSLDDAPRGRQVLVDIGLSKSPKESKNNYGFGKWDGEIIHLWSAPEIHSLILLRNKNWTVEMVETVMGRYTSTFKTINDDIETYDFQEVIVEELIQWNSIPARPQPAVVED